HPETKKLDEVTAEVETIAKQKRSLIAELIEFSEDSQETDDDDYPTISKNINKILIENEISSELKEDSSSESVENLYSIYINVIPVWVNKI
ncbi:hypothetical protein BpHYR1_031741, partial [Brachionus plicatilis]